MSPERSEILPLQNPSRAIVNQINARIHKIEENFSRTDSTGKPATTRHDHPLSYDGHRNNSDLLESHLRLRAETGGTNSNIVELIDDLRIIRSLESSGFRIDGVNRRTRELFRDLKSKPSTEAAETQMMELDLILGRAIYLFPHLSAGIEIKLKPGSVERSNQIDEQYYYSNRSIYTNLAEAYRNQQGSSLPDSLLFPLPFSHSTYTHGSGEREAEKISRNHVYFTYADLKQTGHLRTPVLAGVLENPLSSSTPTFFDLQEIEDIRFIDPTEHADFTPYIKSRYKKAGLEDRGTNFDNYFWFRGFVNRSRSGKVKKHTGISDIEWGRLNASIFTPKPGSNLWRYELGLFSHRLKQGFAILRPEAGLDRLFEFSDLRLQRDEESHDTAARLILEAESGGRKTKKHTQIYTGNEIFERLAELPDTRKF